MFFAMLGAAITLVIPLIVRYITSTVVEKPLEQATGEIIRLGILMIAMVLVEMYCNFYIAYYGHVMGARIEHDMRNEIFGHYQKLSFAFFDNQKVGHLLSRITSDLFDISELLHHGPEDIVISFIKLIGAMIILFVVNPMLACVPLVVIVVMLLFALVMNSRMKSAFKENRRRIADINSQIEDSLSGIRVVKSFGNETEEMRKFNAGNDRFVDSKKVSYRYMGIYNSGMGAFSTLITVISLIVGALLMTGGKLGAADLVTFLLYINNCTDPEEYQKSAFCMKKRTLHILLFFIGILMIGTSYVNLSDLTVPAAIACGIYILVMFVYTQVRYPYVKAKQEKKENK